MKKKELAARIATQLARIAGALEAASAPEPCALDLSAADGFVFEAEASGLRPVSSISAVPLDLLVGLDPTRDTLLDNTRRFARGLPANNALLWGARGMGKSSLIKAVHRQIASEEPPGPALIEIHREDLAALPALLRLLAGQPRRALLFCDDLSFDQGEASYKSLKAALEGGLEGRPSNVLFYATSNRRHLMPRQMIENERGSAIHPSEAVEEKVSLSDRFGLWLGFHPCDQATYLEMARSYARAFGIDDPDFERQALEWATTRGARSGRVAWQFALDAAGRRGVAIDVADLQR